MMKSRTLTLGLIGTFLAVVLIPSIGSAWGSLVHRKITSDAFFIMPQAFRTYLLGAAAKPGSAEFITLLDASNEPDRVLKDFQNHVFHIHGYKMGNGPFRIEELVKEITDLIKKKGSKKEIIQKLGWVAHYTADLVQPLHTGVATWEGIEEKSYHSACEKDADKQVNGFGVQFDGAQPVVRISARMVYEALWANQYYSAIETAYTRGDKYDEARNILSACYSRGVNNVVDMWYTIWANAGGKINPKVDGKPVNYPPAQGRGQRIKPLPR